jgi:hypothetical protein
MPRLSSPFAAATLAAVLSLTVASDPATAQTKKELVARVLLLAQPGVEAMARSIAEQPALQLAQQARQYMPNVPADKRDGVVKAIDTELKKYADEAVPLLRERAIKLAPSTLGADLETNYTETELKELINWFESPVVKRYQQSAPALQRGLAEKLVAETRGQIEPKLKTLETAMAKQLGLPPPGSQPAGGAGAAPVPGGASGAPMPGNRGAEPPRK